MSLTIYELYSVFEHYNKVVLTEEEIRAKFKSMCKENYDFFNETIFNNITNIKDIIDLIYKYLFINDDTSLLPYTRIYG